MSTKLELHVLRVFCDARGGAGNPLGVFPDGRVVPAGLRQEIAGQLGFSETVFVDEPRTGELEIFTPTTRLPFAGHPLVGAAWLLRKRHPSLAALRPGAGEVQIRAGQELTWIGAAPGYSPPWQLRELADPTEVTALEGPPDGLGHVQAWAWADERRGLVRARVFASDYGVEEDPATGSAAIALCAALKRELLVIQGPARAESEILVRPLADGRIELGGRVLTDRPPQAYALADH